MIIFLLVVIVLVAWSLHLMQEAYNRREFSLMLAGTLVAISAAGLIVVYFLMDGYMVYVMSSSQPTLPLESTYLVDSLWNDAAAQLDPSVGPPWFSVASES